MKKIFYSMAVLALAAVSCTKSPVAETEKGYGMLNVGMNIDDVQTRAAMTVDELKADAKVRIYKTDFSGMVREYTYSAMPSPFYLAADSYRVDVEAGESVKNAPVAASWDSKSYKGSKTFEIVANTVTNVEVVANVNNAVTNISFDATVAENFNPGYTFTIGIDGLDAAKLVYDASKSGAE